MPIEGTDQRGNLYLTFDIQFPSRMDQAAKQGLISALQQNEELASNV